MNVDIENSGFENIEANSIISSNDSFIELLPFQNNNSLVYKTRINEKWLLLKRISLEFRYHPAYINALEKEFQLGFNLDHPHIVKYLNKGSDVEGLYLLTEYIDGTSLRNIIHENPQGIKDFKFIERIVLQLLDALGYLHKQQIFHLDLKPENIIITHKGNNVKIIDFGLSSSDSYIFVSSGTKKYSSPEQLITPHKANAQSDFYSLGLIFLELLTGTTKISKLTNTPYRYKRIISKCIEPLQENRFTTENEIIALLNNKSKNTVALIIGVVILILFSVIVGIKYSHYDKILLKKHIHSPIIDKSNRTLDSIFKEAQQNKQRSLPFNDSIFCCRIGDEIFNDFINRVKKYDNAHINEYRNRKSILLDIYRQCNDSINDRLNKYLLKYNKGSIVYYKLNNLFSTHSDLSRKRIDSLIYE